MMNKIVLSAITALAITTSATAMDMFVDKNGQIFMVPGEGRVNIESQAAQNIKENLMANPALTASDTSLKEEVASLKDDMKKLKKKSTSVFAKADKLKFSGLTYIGFTNNKKDNGTDSSQFELRRSYFQLKAYLLDDPKSYFRVTLDLTKDALGDEKARAKYAYLYLNDVLPNTGVEIGLAHRPWHDYEEHNSWMYRSISKVLIEDKNAGPDLSNSADYGVMFKTKTKYFDSDIGIFNGEGYHGDQNTEVGGDSDSMSLEWRATAHLMGENGKDKQTKKTYADASFFGQYNKDHKTVGTEDQDLIFYGLHAVYNQPSFLVSGQYVTSKDTSDLPNTVSGQSGKGYSFNGEYRFGSDYQYRALARYDTWTPEVATGATEKDNKQYILGMAWDQNSNVQWVANIIEANSEVGATRAANNGRQYMVTAEVKF